ncbi:MAG: hypothetical protein SFU86_10705 [Pirellulaceae bacterium]|nr:hypothetical protein [Pirellulaceae bacterium]
MQSHLLDHLAQYVETNARLISGILCRPTGQPLAEPHLFRRPLFYVCPKSGLLKAVRGQSRKGRKPT